MDASEFIPMVARLGLRKIGGYSITMNNSGVSRQGSNIKERKDMQSDKYNDWSIMRKDSIKTLAKEVYKCENCKGFGVKRIPDKGLVPEFMVGNFKAKYWVVGLNPKLRKQDGIMDPNDSKDFDRYFKRIRNFDFDSPYFKRIKDQVFLENWKWGENVAHVDLVKCASRGIDKSFEKAKDNCGDYLERQIKLLKPKLIIANGIEVSKWFKSRKEQKKETNTSILLKFNGFETFVVLSGFIGQMDRCNMVRLREDIKRIKKNGYM